jgi:hypothetical protein|tara:strand:- start:1186 stop:1422 length:237 start_codon:yes stop_codon:yes gene_type:complete
MRKNKKGGGLKPQKMTRQKAKLLCRMADGGESAMDNIMLGSLEEKMIKGGDANRVASSADGSSKMQAYKRGGWTYSGK